MKNIYRECITIFVLCVITNWGQAQNVDAIENIKHEIETSDLFVHGEVVDVSYAREASTGLIYTLSKLKKADQSVVIVETFGGQIGDDLHFSFHKKAPQIGQKGFWVLDESAENRFNVKSFYEDDSFPIARVDGDSISKSQFYRLGSKIQPQISTSVNTLTSCGAADANGFLTVELENPRYSAGNGVFELDITAESSIEDVTLHDISIGVAYSKAIGEFLDSIGAVIHNTPEGKGYDESYTYLSADLNDTTLVLSLEFDDDDEPIVLNATKKTIATLEFDVSKLHGAGSFSLPSVTSTTASYICEGEVYDYNTVELGSPIDAIQCEGEDCIPLTYRIRNLTVDENDQDVTFNLSVEGSSEGPSRFSDGIIRLKYNTAMFGTSLAGITQVSGTFDFPFSVYDALIVDVAPGEADVFVFNESDDINNLTILTEELPCLRLVIPYIDCNVPHDLDLGISTLDNRHTHQTSQIPIEFEEYDPVTVESFPSSVLCGCSGGNPEITSFSPSTISAGTGDILTINGINFGTFDNNLSKVLFIDGDEAFNATMQTGRNDFKWNDIVHWTDTKIEVRVPSVDGLVTAAPLKPASTGPIRVSSKCATSADSETNLFVPYAITSIRISNGSTPVTLIPLSKTSTNEKEVEFRLHSSVPNNYIPTLQSAVDEFATQTGIAFTLISSPKISGTPEDVDDVNLISFIAAPIGGATHNVSAAYYATNTCASTTTGFAFGFMESDIVITGPDVVAPQPALLAELKKSLKHELGHAAMLGHAHGNGQLLDPNANASGQPTSDDIMGVCRSLVFSNTFATASCGTALPNCQTSSLEEPFTYDPLLVMLYPNPTFNSKINLKFSENIDPNKQFKIRVANSIGQTMPFRLTSLSSNSGEITLLNKNYIGFAIVSIEYDSIILHRKVLIGE